MKLKLLTMGFLVLTLSLSTGAASADSGRNGQLHLTKECSQYSGATGSFCTITSSNLAEITKGSRIFYDQAGSTGTPAVGLDSNVVLHVGVGDWAVGRCTLDGTTGAGICTFSDGTGRLTGFTARVNVSYADGPNFRWDGTYSFTSQPER